MRRLVPVLLLALALAGCATPVRLELRFFRGMTQSRIAEELGISQMHVSRLLSRILAFLREQMSEGEDV